MTKISLNFAIIAAAFLMVAMIGGAFFIGGQNEPESEGLPEPGLPYDETMMLTYQVNGTQNGGSVYGSFDMQLTLFSYGFIRSGPLHIRMNIDGVGLLMPSISTGAESYLDQNALYTVWGEKEVLRYIGTYGEDGSLGFIVNYRGAQTGLPYRVDQISPTLKVTYCLVDVNITGMESLDLHSRKDLVDLTASRHLESRLGQWLSDGSTTQLMEPENGMAYVVNLTSVQYNFIIFDERNIWNMIEGGDFQYNEDWSLFGNGTSNFIVQDQMVFYLLYEGLDVPGQEAHFVITATEI